MTSQGKTVHVDQIEADFIAAVLHHVSGLSAFSKERRMALELRERFRGPASLERRFKPEDMGDGDGLAA